MSLTEEAKKAVLKKTKKYTKIALIVLAIIILVYLIVFKWQEEGKVSIVAESSLEKVVEISELPTVEYTYNAVATKENKKEKVEYYVAYKGYVTAGIEFNDITFEVINERDRKQVVIHLPEVTIQDYRVDAESLDFIFIKSSAETETVLKDAYSLCKQDLASRINGENELYVIAEENAKAAVKCLYEPWIDELYPEYEIVID